MEKMLDDGGDTQGWHVRWTTDMHTLHCYQFRIVNLNRLTQVSSVMYQLQQCAALAHSGQSNKYPTASSKEATQRAANHDSHRIAVLSN